MYQTFLSLFFSLVVVAASSTANTKRAVCSPVAQGWEEIDDAPAINQAISDCGNEGTIILAADQIYSVRSQIDFAPCKNCDFQLEGQLIFSSEQWTYWHDVGALIKVAGVSGAKIRSLTGKGLVDGNAIQFYYRDRWMGEHAWDTGPHFLWVTNGSSSILVDNLTVKNVPLRFFRAEGNSTNLTYSRLTLTVEQQFGDAPVSSSETFGFEMGDVTDVTIDTIAMDFRSRPDGIGIGVCAAFDKGTNGVIVKNINCNSWGGVGVMIGTSWTSAEGENIGRPELQGHGVSNIHVSNVTFSGSPLTANGELGWAAGYMNVPTSERIFNITWEDVTVLSGGAVVGDRCYLRCRCNTWSSYQCVSIDWNEDFDDLRFINFKGNIGDVPGPGWGCAANQTLCDIKFEGWTPTNV